MDDTVKLDFKFANGQTVNARVSDIIPDDKRTNTVIVFECKDITDRLLKVRRQSVDIIFTTYSGLRISSKALYHEQNGNVSQIETMPSPSLTNPNWVAKANPPKEQLIPYDAVKAIELTKPRTGTDDAHTLNRLDLVIIESGGIEMKDGNSLDEDTVKGVESNNATG